VKKRLKEMAECEMLEFYNRRSQWKNSDKSQIINQNDFIPLAQREWFLYYKSVDFPEY